LPGSNLPWRLCNMITEEGRCNIAGAISLFLNIAGAIAPVAPVLNTPLPCISN
jgi:hypothetical protein